MTLFFIPSLATILDVNSSNGNWLFDIFSWEHLMSVATVFALLTTTAIIPVWHMFKKRKEAKEKEQDEKDTEKIKKISHELLSPIAGKLNEHDEVLKDMKLSSKQNDKNTYDTLSTLRSLVSEFHTEFNNYKDNQHKVNARLYFLEGAYNTTSGSAAVPGNIPGYRDWRTINREKRFMEDNDLNENDLTDDNNHNHND